MAEDDSGDEVKEHESELSETSNIEMMDIDDDEDEQEAGFFGAATEIPEMAAAR